MKTEEEKLRYLLKVFVTIIFVFLLVLSCTLNENPNDQGGGSGSGSDTDPVLQPISDSPIVSLPAGFDGGLITKDEIVIEIPDNTINYHFVPIGKIYDIKYDNEDSTSFGEDYATLDYSYNYNELIEKGLLEEFFVFYYDESSSSWINIPDIEVDREGKKISVKTNHFTPFVLTAIPSSTGGVADPPSAIDELFPSGIGGTAGASFTIIGDGFKYYKDRDYYIKPITSGSNLATFNALGLDGALAIATCNGNSEYGPESAHKTYTGSNYISFTAHTDLDVYVLYDTRGGGNKFNISRDAPWLADYGFSADIVTDDNPTPTRYFLETTDPLGEYTVYKNTYLEGEEVMLDGNRKGVTDTRINTNYWVILKRKGVYTNEPATNTCTGSNHTAPMPVSDVLADPGATTVTLRWSLPDDPLVTNVIIRRSANGFPLNPTHGEPCTGVELSNNLYEDRSLSTNRLYYYSIFSYNDDSGLYSAAVSVSVKTLVTDIESLAGRVKDGDGVSIHGALLRLYNDTYEFITSSDIDGRYLFKNIPSGTYTLVIKRDGYTHSTTIVVIP